jgi:hypothetical protein
MLFLRGIRWEAFDFSLVLIVEDTDGLLSLSCGGILWCAMEKVLALRRAGLHLAQY